MTEIGARGGSPTLGHRGRGGRRPIENGFRKLRAVALLLRLTRLTVSTTSGRGDLCGRCWVFESYGLLCVRR